MPLTTPQLTTLKANILAETDPTFVGYRTIGATPLMAAWYNANATPAEFAWHPDADRRMIDEQARYSTFDGLSAGKRDAWGLFLAGAPRDMRKAKNRSAVSDIWGPSTGGSVSEDIYNACTRRITKGEKLLGGSTTKTEGTVTALDLSWYGTISASDIVDALSL